RSRGSTSISGKSTSPSQSARWANSGWASKSIRRSAPRSPSPSSRSRTDPPVGVGIAYVDGPRLRRSLLAAADWVAAGREELNRLNVFPVPDGDTGTNLCLTLRAVAQAVRGLGNAPLPDVTAAMAQASVRGARGNSGMMLLIEEGTVAAGAVDRLVPNAAAQTDVAAEGEYRFCTELLIRGERLPASAAVRQALRRFGSSIVVLETGGLLKAHVHTDTPEEVFQLGATWGTVESTKAEDMRTQRQNLGDSARRAVAFVADTACDLPDAAVFENGIGLVPT